VTKVKALTSRISSGKTPLGGSETYVDDGVLFLRSQNVYDDGLRLDDAVFISEATDESMAVSRVRSGDVLLNITGASIGRSCVVPAGFQPANVNQHVCAIRPKSSDIGPFLSWLFKSHPVKSQIDLAQNGAAREGLNFEQIGNISVPIAPPEEQAKLTAFLGRETAKIDALVAEQEQLITRLKEKRQAVISHAVTKGLNPSVPMKDSGVEWLGTAPAHWQVTPLARIASSPGSLFIDGDWVESKDLSDVGIRYITTGNVGEGKYKEQGNGYISEEKFDELRCTEVFPGDLLISRLNLPIGRACVVPDLGGRIITSVDNVITRPDDAYSRPYLAYMLSSAAHFANMENLARGTTMQRISRSSLGQVRFAIPKLNEQQEIVKHLDTETTRMDNLILYVSEAIALLQERRSALISAAVTGQIDVRGLAPA